MESLSDLEFERRDLEIFKIPDVKTRLSTLQSYFFPRLELLLHKSMRDAGNIYGVGSFRHTTIVRRPQPRAHAGSYKDYEEVFVGIGGRKASQPLQAPELRAVNAFYPPAALRFSLSKAGAMTVIFNPFVYWDRTTPAFRKRVARAYLSQVGLLSPLFASHHLAHGASRYFLSLEEALRADVVAEDGFLVWSAECYLPVDAAHGLCGLQRAFIVLYPLFDTATRLSMGLPHRLGKLLAGLREWLESDASGFDPGHDVEDLPAGELNLPDLRDYEYVRAGRDGELPDALP